MTLRTTQFCHVTCPSFLLFFMYLSTGLQLRESYVGSNLQRWDWLLT
jgi:hypothetical protein